MCQLFALSSNAPTAVNFSFTGFSARGGHTGEHADGWGVAFHGEGGCRVFLDDAPACRSPLADFLRQHPIRATTVLAHIRKATQGKVQLSNCHPFQRSWRGRHWTFCHNGDLKNFAPRLSGHFRPVGETDSERAFCWILQELKRRLGRHRAPTWRQIEPVLAELAEIVSGFGPFNFIMTNGEAVFAHASTRLHWTRRQHPFVTAHLVDRDLILDLSVQNGIDDRMVLVATEPLTRNEEWTAFEPGELRVFVSGESVHSTRVASHA